MTDEEATRFAPQLREAELVRAQIAEDEAAADVNDAQESPLPVAPPAVDRLPSAPAVIAA